MMKKLLLPITWTIILIMVSCNSKKSEIIAIDILLTLPDKMYAQAIHLNQLMLSNNPESIKQDKNKIPHITLFKFFVNKTKIIRKEKSWKAYFQWLKMKL